MNLSQIRSLVSLYINDASQTRFSASQYLDAINHGQAQFAYDSKCLFKDAPTYTTVDGTAAYDLPDDFWLEKQITHKGLEILPISRATLLKENGDDWTDDPGTPESYIIDPEEARKQFRLYPIPQADDAGANLILTYHPIPTDLSADSDVPMNSSTLLAPYHIGIAAYAAWLLLGYEEQTPPIASKRADFFKQYSDKVTEAIDYFGNTSQEPIKINPPVRWRMW